MSEAAVCEEGDWRETGRHGDSRDELRAATLRAYAELFPGMTGEQRMRLMAHLEDALPGIMHGLANPSSEPVLHLRASPI